MKKHRKAAKNFMLLLQINLVYL